MEIPVEFVEDESLYIETKINTLFNESIVSSDSLKINLFNFNQDNKCSMNDKLLNNHMNENNPNNCKKLIICAVVTLFSVSMLIYICLF